MNQVIVSGFDPAGPFAGMILPPAFRARQAETRFKQEWRLSLMQYAAMFGKYQRGSLSLLQGVLSAESGPSGSVVLTAHVFQAATNGPATSGIQFERDGQLFELDSVSGNVEQAGEWWSDEPEATIGDDFAARHLSAGKVGTYSNQAAAANSWATISTVLIWDVDAPQDGTKACDATFEVGPQPSGPADDSAFIELTAIDIGL